MAFQKAMNERNALPVEPPHPLTDAEREQATLWGPAEGPRHPEHAQVRILRQPRPRRWDAYVKELEAQNGTAYIDMVNAAHERYKKQHG